MILKIPKIAVPIRFKVLKPRISILSPNTPYLEYQPRQRIPLQRCFNTISFFPFSCLQKILLLNRYQFVKRPISNLNQSTRPSRLTALSNMTLGNISAKLYYIKNVIITPAIIDDKSPSKKPITAFLFLHHQDEILIASLIS